MNRVVFAPKQLTASEKYTFDFISLLAEGETLAGAAVDVAVFTGTDASPAAILDGAPTIEGTKVIQDFTGGVLGAIYTVTCMAGTCNDQVFSLAAYLAIIKDAAV